MSLRDCENSLRIRFLLIQQNTRRWQTVGQTDRQTDTAQRHRPLLCIAPPGNKSTQRAQTSPRPLHCRPLVTEYHILQNAVTGKAAAWRRPLMSDIIQNSYLPVLRKVNKKLINRWSIDRWDKRTLPPEPRRRRCNILTAPTLNFLVTFAYLVGESRLFRRIMIFWLFCLVNTLTFLLTYEFLVEKYPPQFYK